MLIEADEPTAATETEFELPSGISTELSRLVLLVTSARFSDRVPIEVPPVTVGVIVLAVVASPYELVLSENEADEPTAATEIELPLPVSICASGTVAAVAASAPPT